MTSKSLIAISFLGLLACDIAAEGAAANETQPVASKLGNGLDSETVAMVDCQGCIMPAPPSSEPNPENLGPWPVGFWNPVSQTCGSGDSELRLRRDNSYSSSNDAGTWRLASGRITFTFRDVQAIYGDQIASAAMEASSPIARRTSTIIRYGSDQMTLDGAVWKLCSPDPDIYMETPSVGSAAVFVPDNSPPENIAGQWLFNGNQTVGIVIGGGSMHFQFFYMSCNISDRQVSFVHRYNIDSVNRTTTMYITTDGVRHLLDSQVVVDDFNGSAEVVASVGYSSQILNSIIRANSIRVTSEFADGALPTSRQSVSLGSFKRACGIP